MTPIFLMMCLPVMTPPRFGYLKSAWQQGHLYFSSPLLILRYSVSKARKSLVQTIQRYSNMSENLVITMLVVSIFGLLDSGVCVGLSLSGSSLLGMTLLCARPVGSSLAMHNVGCSSGLS